MKLNLFAGRTLNDINQYPVFPWILKYEDDADSTINLENELLYRNLSLPIGAIDKVLNNYYYT